jgi:hypothetical protein
MKNRRAIPPGGSVRYPLLPFLLTAAIFFAAPLLPRTFASAAAQGTDRIWGRVETAAGQVYEGYIRWDRNEGSWVDLLNGSKESSREAEALWKELAAEEGGGDRVIEFFDIRISWDDRDFPGTADSGIRFGHIRRLIVLDDQTVELELKSGERIQLEGGSTDLGNDMRELLIDTPTEGIVELGWRDLDQIQFGPAPGSTPPEGTRIYGTVEDRWGDRYTGYISWDLDEILTTDNLDGEEDGEDRVIPFGRISGIEKDMGRSRVFLTDGVEMVLSGSNDVEDGNRGIQISDPGLGMVEVEWDEFAFVRFHEPESHTGYDAFDGGHRLKGTVVNRDGEEFTGWILWDADEGYSWEILDGEDRDVIYDVEFGKIATIERDSARSALVTLLDGRVLELEGSNDVNDENKGIFIHVDDQARSGAEGWVRVSWDDFREIRFEH